MFKMRKMLATATLAAITTFMLMPAVAMADEAAGAAGSETAAVSAPGSDNIHTVHKYIALAAGLGLGLAAIGGALGQGRTAAAALDGIARNPGASGKIFTPMILGLALIESLVIYSLVISFILVGKIG